MVKLGCSFSGKPSKDAGDQDVSATDSVPLISPLDVSQLQPPFADQVVIKTQTEYQLSSTDQLKKFPDLEGQKLTYSHPEEGRRLPTARMIAFVMAFLGCVLIMYKAIWYDQLTCPDGFLLRHKICTPLTLEMYYTEMNPEHHRSILTAFGAYPMTPKHSEMSAAWEEYYRTKEVRKGSARAVGVATATTEPAGQPTAEGEEKAHKVAGSATPPAPQ